ncbi:hypothetical protein PEPS_40120 (plasmid) [Persicobacter psychrovividus]|uniref:Uncharacterized protein n=1 Tax=Persicobacter psychrovividus TaxID=387638 RepID=A0ABN6LF60_9BACT|nr:hypothetical protein PEPS_40120 [Persicobacter psychrovividus]
MEEQYPNFILPPIYFGLKAKAFTKCSFGIPVLKGLFVIDMEFIPWLNGHE